jgi:hypothetical protein
MELATVRRQFARSGEPCMQAVMVAPDDDTHRVVLRRVFAKTVEGQRGERSLEIIGAESKMGISAVNVAGSEGTWRIEN